MNLILKVVTGSRLHNLNKPDSDTDYRGIFLDEMENILSPFRKPVKTLWIEGDEDNTAYELREFANEAVHGTPNILEILFSNQVIDAVRTGSDLIENRKKFLDSANILQSYRNYAHNQYNKMNLFDPDERTPKFAVAYLRSLRQGVQLLKTGEMNSQVLPEERDFLMEIKYEFDKVKHIPLLSQKFSELQQEMTEAYANSPKLKPDKEWIEKFIINAYTPVV